jgi:MFS family permease
VLVPAGQAVIGSVAGRAQLGRIFGLLGFVIALGPAVGPAVGGLLLEGTSWRALFWLNVPVGVAALLAARGLVPPGDCNADRSLDWRGLLLLGTGLPALLFGAAEISSAGPSAPALVACGGGALLVAACVLTSRYAASPLIDLRLLRHRAFASATATAGLTGANLYGGLLLLPLYLQLVAGHGTAATGMLLLAMGLGTAVALPVAGTLTDRFGAGVVSLAGAVLLASTTVPFLLPGTLAMSALLPALVIRGVALAWAQMPAVTAAYAAAGPEQAGDAATVVNIVQRVGGALGAIGLVVVLGQTGGDGAYRVTFGVLTVVSLLIIVMAALLRRSTNSRPAS